MILAGDIGATNTRLALYEGNHEAIKIAEGRFSSKNSPGLLPIVQTFLKQHPQAKLQHAVFGLAGPVENGLCQTTNLPWIVDAHQLEKQLHFPVDLLNDLEANAWGLSALKPCDIFVLQGSIVDKKGNAALIAAGTGLGEAGLYWDGQRHHPFATEGGHTDFAPRDEREIDLLRYLTHIYGHVSNERIISGPGLYHLYQFLIASGKEHASETVTKEMKNQDPSAVISKWGLSQQDAACAQAVDWFVSLYGAEAGNVALKFMTRGGLYVGGKIASIFLDALKKGEFTRAFCNKGRFSQFLQTIPIFIVLNEETSLLGAFKFANHRKS